ncbi:unnamed protein product [Phytophthora lilii]|uniref:Unnamed protein product n=1 Tax=Phytophthora lilii TaxID=2077276 RepID=A0A9W6TGC7_9STRA|nr:unnamed protein product [Phytophthora lilii]
MPSPDAAFLAEVEEFLLDSDLLPHAQHEAKSHGEMASVLTISSNQQLVDNTTPVAKLRARQKSTLLNVDATAKLELARAKDRKRRSVYRERRRLEKEHLKQQVAELSTQVGELQKTKKSEAAAAWEMIAKRQLHARASAEAEQRRLLSAIGFRAKLIGELHSVVRNRISTNALDRVDPGETAYHRNRMRLEASDVNFLREYMQEIDTYYAQTDKVLRTCDLDSTNVAWSDSRQRWKEGKETGQFVYVDKYVIPFSFKHTCKVLWRAVQLHHRQEDRQHFYEVGDHENMSAFKLRITKRLHSGRTVSVLQLAVARRYVEADRMVIVWRSFTEGETVFAGMHADECGWCVSTASSNALNPSTLLRTAIRHTPLHFSSNNEPTVAQFTGFLIDTGMEDTVAIGNRLQKLLLQAE